VQAEAPELELDLARQHVVLPLSLLALLAQLALALLLEMLLAMLLAMRHLLSPAFAPPAWGLARGSGNVCHFALERHVVLAAGPEREQGKL